MLNSQDGVSNALVISSQNLPDTPKELVKFALVAQEKLASVKAEIRAIKHLKLAQEVERQKIEEARIISEALLDAQTLIGDMTRNLPTASGGDRRSENFKRYSVGPFEKSCNRTSTISDEARAEKRSVQQKTKQDAIKELGLSKKQVKQFEILSKNRDLVELAKAQARENDDIPTRTQVLTMAQARQRVYDADIKRIDTDYETIKKFHAAIFAILCLKDDDDTLQSLVRGLGEDISSSVSDITEAISKLTQLKTKILYEKGRLNHGKKQIP